MSWIKRIDFKRVTKPLKITFSTASGKKEHMESLIISVLLKTKNTGLGESSTSRAFPSESLEVMEGILKKIIPALVGKDVRESLSIMGRLKREYPDYRLTFSGLEMALFRAYLSLCRLSEYSFWGGKSRILETDITIPNIEKAAAVRWALQFAKKGFRFFKIKLMGNPENDISFVRAISDALKEALEEGYWIRLDMNESYNARDFLTFRAKLDSLKIPVQCVEQPLKRADYDGLKEIMKESRFEIILDESVRDTEDLDRVGATGFKGGVNIKIAKSGMMESKRIYDMAKKNGLKLMIGCMTETATGLSAGIHFALGRGDFEYVDLDSIHFLKGRRDLSSLYVSGPYYVFSRS